MGEDRKRPAGGHNDANDPSRTSGLTRFCDFSLGARLKSGTIERRTSYVLRGHMQRREFLTILGGVSGWPIMVRAQQTERMRRIGVLMAHAETDPEYRDYLAAFREDSISSDGRKVAIFKSTLAGAHSTTRR